MSKNKPTKQVATVVAVGLGGYSLYTQWPKLRATWREWSATQQLGALLALVVGSYIFYKTAEGLVTALGEL